MISESYYSFDSTAAPKFGRRSTFASMPLQRSPALARCFDETVRTIALCVFYRFKKIFFLQTKWVWPVLFRFSFHTHTAVRRVSSHFQSM